VAPSLLLSTNSDTQRLKNYFYLLVLNDWCNGRGKGESSSTCTCWNANFIRV